MSFEPWKENSFLIRFEHIMEKNEDPQQSLPVSFNLSHIFPGEFTFSEVTLGANQWIEDMNRLHFKHEGAAQQTYEKLMNKAQMVRQIDNREVIVIMNPMEIRTFIMSPIVDATGGGTKSQTAIGFIIIISIFVIPITRIRS